MDIWESEVEIMSAVKRARVATPSPDQEEIESLELAWEYWVGRVDVDEGPSVLNLKFAA